MTLWMPFSMPLDICINSVIPFVRKLETKCVFSLISVQLYRKTTLNLTNFSKSWAQTIYALKLTVKEFHIWHFHTTKAHWLHPYLKIKCHDTGVVHLTALWYPLYLCLYVCMSVCMQIFEAIIGTWSKETDFHCLLRVAVVGMSSLLLHIMIKMLNFAHFGSLSPF